MTVNIRYRELIKKPKDGEPFLKFYGALGADYQPSKNQCQIRLLNPTEVKVSPHGES